MTHPPESLDDSSSARRTLAVFAHFDPDGLVAPHVARYITALNHAVDRVVVVSTGKPSTDLARLVEDLGPDIEMIERDNTGYDFYSWKTGLDYVGHWDDYDRVVLCNDSVVGPLRPLTDVLGPNAPRDVDFWGMTISQELSAHVQSWFLVFERTALDSGLVQGFWRAMRPETDRYWVIRRYEVGISRLLSTAGLRMGSYLQPSLTGRVRAQYRYRRAQRGRPELAAAVRRAIPPGGRMARERDMLSHPRYNPSYVFWDAALSGELPFVKVEILRDDPYLLGPERVLSTLERVYPEAFAGVRDYIARTRDQVRSLRGIG